LEKEKRPFQTLRYLRSPRHGNQKTFLNFDERYYLTNKPSSHFPSGHLSNAKFPYTIFEFFASEVTYMFILVWKKIINEPPLENLAFAP